MIFSMPKKVILRDLFPEQTDEQIERIAEFLHGYCAVVWRIYERLEREHLSCLSWKWRKRSSLR